jgi:hypothetical protein
MYMYTCISPGQRQQLRGFPVCVLRHQLTCVMGVSHPPRVTSVVKTTWQPLSPVFPTCICIFLTKQCGHVEGIFLQHYSRLAGYIPTSLWQRDVLGVCGSVANYFSPSLYWGQFGQCLQNCTVLYLFHFTAITSPVVASINEAYHWIAYRF